jgi:hypothetical protein
LKAAFTILNAVLGFSVLAALSACGPSFSPLNDHPAEVSIKPVPNKLSYSSLVPREQRAALNEAISAMAVLPLDLQDADTKSMAALMKLEDVSPKAMQSWMEERVQYIVEDGFDLRTNIATGPAFLYEHPGVLPDTFNLSTPTQEPIQERAETTEPGESNVAMLNIGAAVYAAGKQDNVLLVASLSGVGEVALTSPRTGLLEIGPGLFQDTGGLDVQNIALDIARAGTLFHEARHSDGNGHSLGFMHARCPDGDFKGMAACDLALNGPYSIGAAVHKALMNKCANAGLCNEVSRMVLEFIYADQASRLIDAAQAPAALSNDTPAGKNWDDTPEGTRFE